MRFDAPQFTPQTMMLPTVLHASYDTPQLTMIIPARVLLFLLYYDAPHYDAPHYDAPHLYFSTMTLPTVTFLRTRPAGFTEKE